MNKKEYCDEHDVSFPNFKGYLWHIKETHQGKNQDELGVFNEY